MAMDTIRECDNDDNDNNNAPAYILTSPFSVPTASKLSNES